MDYDVKMVLDTLHVQILKVNKLHGSIHDAAEGYGLLLEEYAELLDEVRHKEPSWRRIGQEAVDVACVAARILGSKCCCSDKSLTDIGELHSIHQGFGLLSQCIYKFPSMASRDPVLQCKDILRWSLRMAVFAKKRCG